MRIIKNWEELEKLEPSKTHKILDEGGCGLWIVPINANSIDVYSAHYICSHAFYKKSGTPHILKAYGWDVELEAWE